MNYSNGNTTHGLGTALFQPKILVGLFVLWLVVVLVGSGIAIMSTNMGLMSDAEVEELLSENEELARATNVAYTSGQTNQAQQPQISETLAFPDRIEIPSIGTNLPVSNPQTRNIEALDTELQSAVVRYPDSAMLGQQGGNVLIFGHSSHLPIVHNKLYKAFNDIETLKNGDTIRAYAGYDVYTYQVTRVYQASAHDAQIPLGVAGHRITLLTCDSFGAKSDRWVVEAEFIGKNI